MELIFWYFLRRVSGLCCGLFSVPKNCADVFDCGGRKNGVYTINPDGKDNFKVSTFTCSI
jgi:hypothetical protein